MAEKDNANPIIHASSSSSASFRPTSAAQSQWWRDPSVHSSHAASSALANDSLAFSVYEHDDVADDDDDDDDDDDEKYGGDHGSHPQMDGEEATQDVEMHEVVAGRLGVAKSDSNAKPDRQREEIDSQEIYDLIRSVTDPEHPLTLEQLAVVNAAHITVDQGSVETDKLPHVLLEFTPTIPHCSMATLIGLSLRVRLLRALPPRYKVDIRVRPGTHQSENAVNKQLNDKERVAAALENAHLLDVVQGCLSSAARRGKSEDDVRREIEEGQGAGGDVWKTVEEVAKRLGVQV